MDDTLGGPSLAVAADTALSDARRPENPRSDLDDENFNYYCPRRAEILCQMQELLAGQQVRVPFWAFCQVADVDTLQTVLNGMVLTPHFIQAVIDCTLAAPRLWAQKPPKIRDSISQSSGGTEQQVTSISGTSPSKTRPFRRSEALKAKVKKRDGNICILAKRWPCEVAHIFPHYLLKPIEDQTKSERSYPSIWTALLMFWPKEKVKQWQQCVFPGGPDAGNPRDSVSNMVCMGSDLQKAWAEGLFALRPMRVSDDKRTFDLEFHWLPLSKHESCDSVSIVERPLSTAGITGVKRCFILDESEHRLASGDIITLKTPDPVKLPLPSYELLELAWHLARVVSLSGAGAPDEPDYDFEDDDGSLISNTARDRILDWIPMTNTPPTPSTSSSYPSSTGRKLSTMISTSSSPEKNRTADDEVIHLNNTYHNRIYRMM